MLPIIRLAGLTAPRAEERAATAAAIRAASLDNGFFYLAEHGVPDDLLKAMFVQMERFFSLPIERKRRSDKALSSCNRGYEPLGGQVLEPGRAPDQKEGYYIGQDLGADDPRVAAGWFNHGPNLWPDDLPGWREVMERYFDAMSALSTQVMRGLALSLDLPEDHFDGFCEDGLATLRLLHYPPQPANPHPDELGCGAHTDFGAVTLLLQDQVGGLQVWDQTAGWRDAPPLPGAFIVNLGDLIARWTNDRYRSTRHRVINASGLERYSAPFFLTGNATYDVVCLPTCLEPGEAPRYAPTTPLKHLKEMYDLTYSPVRPA
jgi:isopenicillin N synthase-like dioxygenase